MMPSIMEGMTGVACHRTARAALPADETEKKINTPTPPLTNSARAVCAFSVRGRLPPIPSGTGSRITALCRSRSTDCAAGLSSSVRENPPCGRLGQFVQSFASWALRQTRPRAPRGDMCADPRCQNPHADATLRAWSPHLETELTVSLTPFAVSP